MYNQFISNEISSMDIDANDYKKPFSGFSGILFALPAIIDYPIYKSIWITQAIVSVLADYFYIDRKHCIHGIDRIFANINLIRILYIIFTFNGWHALVSWIMVLLSFNCFFLAKYYKKNGPKWVFWHGCWHIIAAPGCFLVIFLNK